MKPRGESNSDGHRLNEGQRRAAGGVNGAGAQSLGEKGRVDLVGAWLSGGLTMRPDLEKRNSALGWAGLGWEGWGWAGLGGAGQGGAGLGELWIQSS